MAKDEVEKSFLLESLENFLDNFLGEFPGEFPWRTSLENFFGELRKILKFDGCYLDYNDR